MHALTTPGRGRIARLRPNAISRAALLALLLASGGAAPTWAQAQAVSATARYAIDAKDLGQALREYGAASGTSLLSYPPEWVQGLRSSAVRGQYSAGDALSLLLEGTGLRAVAQPGGGFVLERVPRQVRTVDLPTVSVTATLERIEERSYRQQRSSVYLDRERVERFRGSSAADFLSGVEGVHTGDVRNGGALDVNVRGIQGQNRVPVIVDGGQQSIDAYRGYSGQQQRSYLDPDLISEVTVDKGPTLEPDAAGAIGGAVRISTLQAQDILAKGKSSGWRVRGSLANNGVKPTSPYWIMARERGESGSMGNFANAAGSLAYALSRERYDLVAAYAWRRQGNYFAGRRGASDYDRQNLSSGGMGLAEEPITYYFRGGEEVPNTNIRNESLMLKATLRPTDAQSLDLSYRYFNSFFGEIMPTAIRKSLEEVDGRQVGMLSQFEPGNMRVHSLSARHRYQPEDNDWIDLKTNAWVTDSTSIMYNGNAFNVPLFIEKPYDFNPDPLSEEYGPALRSDVSNRRWGVDVSNTSRLSSAVGAFKFDYGAAFQHESLGPNSPRVEADLRNNRYLRNGTRREASVSGAVEWRPAKRLALTAGGRYTDYALRDRNRKATVTASYDRYYRDVFLTRDGEVPPEFANDLRYKRWYPDDQGNYTWESLRNSTYGSSTLGETYDFDGYTTQYDWLDLGEEPWYEPEVVATAWSYSDPVRNKGRGFAPTLSLSYDLGAQSLAYVRYAQGLRMPSLFDSTLGNPFIESNATLRPERNRMLEVGVSTLHQGLLRPGDRTAFKLAWFNNDVRDFITRAYVNDVFYITNMNSFKTSGFELQSSYDAGWFYAQLSGTYYQKARTCDAATGAMLRGWASDYPALANTPNCVDGGFGGAYTNQQNPPRYSLYTTLGVRLLQRRLDLGVRSVYNSGPRTEMDKPWHLSAPTGRQNLYLSTTIYDLYASWTYSPQVRLSFVVNNLTDRYYVDPLALSQMPAPGRTLRVSFDLKF